MSVVQKAMLDEVSDQSNAAQSDWCGSQFVSVCGGVEGPGDVCVCGGGVRVQWCMR